MKKNLRSAFNTRQYMLSEDFEIFYYSDVHFRMVDAHQHDYYEFYLFLEGDVQIRIGNTVYPLHPRDVVIIPPGISHQAIVPDSDIPYRRFVLWISRSYCNELLRQSPDYIYLIQKASSAKEYIFHFHEDRFTTLHARALRLLEEIHSNRYGRLAAITLSVNDLILTINRMAYEQEHPDQTEGSQDLIDSLIGYIDSHLEEDLSLESLAGRFYVSRFYLAHYFKENMGLSVHQYITKKRLARCRDAVISGAGITRTFHEYGFSDYSAFYRAFKKEFGISPKECAQIMGAEPGR